MDNSDAPAAIDPRAISVVMIGRAKRFWYLALACGVLGPLFGLGSSFTSLPAMVAPITLVVFAVLAEVFQWRSDALKDVAESLLRKLDLLDSFGWPISSREMSDLEAQNEGLHGAFVSQAPKEAYFGSQRTAGVDRALANLEEAAWWSKHLASQVGLVCALVVAALVVAAFLALVISVEAVQATTAAHAAETLHGVGNVVTASLTLVFSLGLTRIAVAYYTFSGKAGTIESQVDLVASRTDHNETDAVKLWQDYHLARATAPFLPTWVWQMRRKSLNAIWDARKSTR